jgi:peptidoglycan biosynthesis protein MviN/MurJ (putative lipid II flippase)
MVTVRTVVALLIVSYGLVPLAVSSVTITLFGAPVLFHLVARRVGLSPTAYVRGLAPALLATLFMMACVMATDRMLPLPQRMSDATNRTYWWVSWPTLAVLVVACRTSSMRGSRFEQLAQNLYFLSSMNRRCKGLGTPKNGEQNAGRQVELLQQ